MNPSDLGLLNVQTWTLTYNTFDISSTQCDHQDLNIFTYSRIDAWLTSRIQLVDCEKDSTGPRHAQKNLPLATLRVQEFARCICHASSSFLCTRSDWIHPLPSLGTYTYYSTSFFPFRLVLNSLLYSQERDVSIYIYIHIYIYIGIFMYIRYTVNLLVQTTWIFGTLQRTLGICRLVTVRSKAIEVQHPKKGRWMRHCFKPEWCRGLRSYELWDTFPPPANTSDIKRWHLIFASSFRHNGWWCVGSPSQISENCGFHVSMAGQFLAATVENLPLEKHPKPSVSCARLGTSLGTTTS